MLKAAVPSLRLGTSMMLRRPFRPLAAWIARGSVPQRLIYDHQHSRQLLPAPAVIRD